MNKVSQVRCSRFLKLWPLAIFALGSALTWAGVRGDEPSRLDIGKLSKGASETKGLTGPANKKGIFDQAGQGQAVGEQQAGSNLERVTRVLEALGVRYQRAEGKPDVVLTSLTLEKSGRTVQIVIKAKDGGTWIGFRNVWSLPSPSNEQFAALMQRNYDLIVGRYGRNKENGEVMFDNYIVGELNEEVFALTLQYMVKAVVEDAD